MASNLYGGRTAKRAIVDLGPAPGGVSKARYVATRDLSEYIVKAPSFCLAVGPYIPANELIAAELANAADIPVLPWQFIQLPSGDLGWGSLRVDTADFANMGPTIFASLDEPDMISAVAVFDLWIGNTDRHNGNLLGRRNRRGGGYSLLANDHSHALVREMFDPTQLYQHYQSIPMNAYFRSNVLRANVTLCDHFKETLELIESLDESDIRSIVEGVPDNWMSGSIRKAVADFLIGRAQNLRTLLNQALVLFPQMSGVSL